MFISFTYFFILEINEAIKIMCITIITIIPSISEKMDMHKEIIVIITGGIINKSQSHRFHMIYSNIGINQIIHKIIKALLTIYHLPT